ncbi:MAG: hypothetical protein DWQ04_10955, partial [Chloroflexi bacterium]
MNRYLFFFAILIILLSAGCGSVDESVPTVANTAVPIAAATEAEIVPTEPIVSLTDTPIPATATDAPEPATATTAPTVTEVETETETETETVVEATVVGEETAVPPTEAPESTSEPIQEPTAEPVEEPTAKPVEEPTVAPAPTTAPPPPPARDLPAPTAANYPGNDDRVGWAARIHVPAWFDVSYVGRVEGNTTNITIGPDSLLYIPVQ